MTQFPQTGEESGTRQHSPHRNGLESLFGREAPRQIDLESMEYLHVLDEKCVFVTGAGGWIGSRLAIRLAKSRIRKLVLLDSSESALYEIDQALAGTPAERVAVCASICDPSALIEVFEQHRPGIVFHAAALKHVPLMESHPFEVIKVNSLGTVRLAETAQRFGCDQIVMISTDKAVDPASLMGASKRIAELAMFGLVGGTMRVQVVRLGNVLGSSGSVVPLFLRQLAQGGPLTVSHPQARRFFITTEDAVEEVLDSLSPNCPEGLLVTTPGDPIRIVDLANFLIARSAKIAAKHGLAEPEKANSISIVFTGLRPGDKLEESLISRRESYSGQARGLRRQVITPVPLPGQLEIGINALASAVDRRDLEDLLQAILQLVPEYRLGPLVQQSRAACVAEMAQ